MRNSFIYAGLLLSVSIHAFAAAPMTLIPNTTNITLRSDGSALAAYTVTNTTTAGTILSGFTIYPNPSNAPVSTSVQNNTCSILHPAASCTFQILISGINVGTSFTLSPEICVFNNSACAVATSNYRPTTTVVPVTQPVQAYSALLTGPYANSIQPVVASTQQLGTLITNPGFDFQTIISDSTRKNPQGGDPIHVGFAIAPNGETIYMTNPGNGNISFINVAQTPPAVSNITLPLPPSIKATIPEHAEPTAVVVTPNNQTLYTLDPAGDRIYVINIASRTITDALSTAVGTNKKSPCLNKQTSSQASTIGGFSLAINPPGTIVYAGIDTELFKINTSNNTISLIDCEFVNGPRGMVVTPDNSTLYIANTNDDTVSVLDTASSFITATISVGAAPSGVAISPNGATLYVANTGANTITVINTATNQVINVLSLPGDRPAGLSLTPDGTLLYVGYNGSTFTSVINTTTFEITNINVTGEQVNFGGFVG